MEWLSCALGSCLSLQDTDFVQVASAPDALVHAGGVEALPHTALDVILLLLSSWAVHGGILLGLDF